MNDLPSFQQTAAAYNHEPALAPLFFVHEGIECVKVLKAGDTRQISVFPADSQYDTNEFGEPLTYAERWPYQYAQFKDGNKQTATGTPLTDAPFLNPSRIDDLNKLKVFTLEGLATFDDRYISRMGGNGYKLKTMAQEFLAKKSLPAMDVDVAALVKQNAELMALLDQRTSGDAEDPYEGKSDDDLRDMIELASGARPDGRRSRKTLIGMLGDLEVPAE
jgi:hypothetical protein